MLWDCLLLSSSSASSRSVFVGVTVFRLFPVFVETVGTSHSFVYFVCLLSLLEGWEWSSSFFFFYLPFICWKNGEGFPRLPPPPPIFIGGQWITFCFVFLLHLWDISNLYPEYAFRVIRRLYPDRQSKQGSKLKKNSIKFITGPDRNPCISLEAISPHDK